MFTRMVVSSLVAALLAASPVVAQIEVDRIVSRVSGRIITQSDVRQARILKLVDDLSSEAAIRRGLETRLLILHELDRAAALPPVGPDELTARRREWEGSVGGEAPGADMLRQSGMAEADFVSWLRDDLRIRAYLRRQFGMLGDTERNRAVADWTNRLRQRADLSD
jgi:hypothetical protein